MAIPAAWLARLSRSRTRRCTKAARASMAASRGCRACLRATANTSSSSGLRPVWNTLPVSGPWAARLARVRGATLPSTARCNRQFQQIKKRGRGYRPRFFASMSCRACRGISLENLLDAAAEKSNTRHCLATREAWRAGLAAASVLNAQIKRR